MTDFVPNRLTPEGRKLGAALAQLADKADQELRAKSPEIGERCASCAFREGTVPNGCAETVMDALKCVMEGIPFLCHQVKDGKVALCAGWYVSQAMLIDKPKLPTPWPFSLAE